MVNNKLQTSDVVASPARLNNHFSTRQLLVVAAIFAVLGVAALIASFAYTPSNGDFEAETMTLEAL